MLPGLKADEKEQSRLQRKRENLEKVKARLLNPRLRVFGVDVETWKKQEEEKRRQKEEERKKELEYQMQKMKEDMICTAMEKKLQEEKKEILKKVQEFRENYQRFEDRREYDLNDPMYKKKAVPIRTCDDDPRCGISSAQKEKAKQRWRRQNTNKKRRDNKSQQPYQKPHFRFEGEDLRREERLRIQSEQTKAWLEQQVAEKRKEEEDKRKAEQLYMEALVARDKRSLELAKLEEECSRKLQQSTAEFNRLLANEKEVKEKNQKLKEELDNEAERINWMNSDFLTENPEVAMSSLGPNKMIGYMYKGGGPEAAKETAKFLEKQVEEKKKRQLEEANILKEWDTIAKRMDRRIYFKDKELMEQQRRLNQEMLEINRKLANEKRQREEHLKNVVYTNVPTDDYYNQFNTSLY